VDLRSLIAAHHAAVYRFAFRLAGQQADAEDVTQQTFLVAQQHLQQLRQPENPLPWLLTIARSCWLKSARRKRPVPAASVELNIDDVAAPRSDREPIDQQELQSALDELPDEFKLVVVMFYFQESSYREIAAELEIPIGTVMSRLARAKAQLRKRLGMIDEGEPQRVRSETVRR
jgi:RNA polymerase sigma-70 factor (ECF subfamily)